MRLRIAKGKLKLELLTTRKCISFYVDGTWRSLVARFLGVEEVAGSNPVVPIRVQTQDETPKTETLKV